MARLATTREATVLIDGNNFYASCEAVMDPAVIGRQLVVLSNNEGCFVSSSTEARALGIAMGVPYFLSRGIVIDDRHPNDLTQFRLINTLLGNLKTSFRSTFNALL